MQDVNGLPRVPEPHPIIELTQQKVITIHQLSLRIGKSYGHTRNLIAGYAKPDEATLQIFDQLMEEFNGENKKKIV